LRTVRARELSKCMSLARKSTKWGASGFILKARARKSAKKAGSFRTTGGPGRSRSFLPRAPAAASRKSRQLWRAPSVTFRVWPPASCRRP
jgi:hypothetical protein